MLATENFVFIHMPKTGGTFVTNVLFKLKKTLQTREIKISHPWIPFWKTNLKHATCCDIPDSHRNKKVLACIRNPYDLYVSAYEFGWWKRREYPGYFRRLVTGFDDRYPDFPDISFVEFLELYHAALCRESRDKTFRDDDGGIGWATQRFIDFYFRNPSSVLPSIDDRYIFSDDSWRDMFDIHFLRTHCLNQNLHDFLAGEGIDDRQLEFIVDLQRILPGGKGRNDNQGWRNYYNTELRQKIRDKDRLLFHLFPEFDVD